MSENRGYAWAVVLPSDDLAECAALSGKMLRKTETSASVVLVVSSCISKEAVTKCSGIFDMILLADPSHSMKLITKGRSNHETDLLLLSTLKLKQFSKLIVITSGTLVLRQLDHLFDDEDFNNGRSVILMNNGKGEEWRVASIHTDSNCTISSWEDFFVKKQNKPKMDIPRHCEDINSDDDLSKYFSSGIVHAAQSNAKALLRTNYDGNGAVDTNGWIAIIGMSCRFPQANSPDEYWELLENGKNTCSVPPQHRLSLTDLDPNVKANFLKCPIDQFDAGFFGISPNEACNTDPQARLLLEVSWEAFEDAGINPVELQGTKTGVFYGSWLQDYKDAITANKSYLQAYIGNGFGNTAAKLSFYYGFTGPNVFTESACSSSIMAVDLAIKSLLRRECPVALACGSNLFLQTSKQVKVLSEDGKSKTFDSSADGYARAEGIAVLVMKRYSDAVRDHDNIYGVIRGSGVSQEGLSKSFGAPTVESEFCAMKRALRAAKVTPADVDYVEAHATGTAVGDPIEAAAIVQAYSEGNRKEPLWIASGKTNIGHAESCSGMAGIIKVLLALKHEIIPRHVNLEHQNPKVDFSPIPGIIPLSNLKWQRNPERARIAGVTSFGITGTHVHMIIQEPPNTRSKMSPPQKCSSSEKQLLTISAKSEIALEQITNFFHTFLERSQDPLENITFTANVLRPHHKFRRTVLATTTAEMASNIQSKNFISLSSSGATKPELLAFNSKICFTFPGRLDQSADRSSIVKLYHNNTYFRDTMDRCHGTFMRVTGYFTPIMSFLLSSGEFDAQVELCLLVSLQYSLVKLWIHWGVHPTAVMGHCGGEFSAAVASGILTLEDVFEMSKFLPYFLECQRRQPVSMLVLNCNKHTTENLVQEFLGQGVRPSSQWIDLSCLNSDDQTVVTGPTLEMSEFQKFCSQKSKIYCKLIPVPYGLHSRAIEPVREIAVQVSKKILNCPMKIPFVSSLTGKILEDTDLDETYWFRVFRQVVHFKQACFTIQTEIRPGACIEIGLGEVLTKLTESNFSKGDQPHALCVATFPKSGIMSCVAKLYTFGVNLNWKRIHRRDESSGLVRVKLPNYPFQRRSFWYDRSDDKRLVSSSYAAKSFVHPLLGVAMKTPANFENVTFFQNDWLHQLSHEKTRFIWDHIVDTMVILPGAAFVEMIVSAWKLSAETKEQKQVAVTNVKIHSPLLLEESVQKQIQCVVDKKNGTVSVFSSTAASSPWKLHAQATLVLDRQQSSGMLVDRAMCHDLKLYMEQNCDTAVENANSFYKAVDLLGLHFGKAFKSIKSICNDPTSDDTLAELELPMEQFQDEDFICHPILIDAMLQTFIFNRNLHLGPLKLPVAIGKILVSTKEKYHHPSDKWYIYCKNQSSVVTLLDQQLNPVATMEEPHFVSTTLAAVRSSVVDTCGRNNGVSLYFDGWQPARFYQPPSHAHPNGALIKTKKSSMEELKVALNTLNPFTPEEAQLDEILNRLNSLYVAKAILDLGWNPEMMKFDDIHQNINEFVKLFDILPGMLRAFKYFVKTYLKADNHVPTLLQVEQEIQATLEDPLAKAYPVIDTIHLCGSYLAQALRGTVSTHKLMFGKDRLAENFYRNSRVFKIQKPLEEMFLHLVGSGKEKECFKILEIGAGTGAFTRGIVTRIRQEGVKFEYHFTDISLTLINKAKEQFSEDEKDKFVFKTLDIEIDPLTQGFPPAYFDVVVAYDVLHATRDLKETLANVALLCKMGGSVLIGETEKPLCEVDICFGTFEGYWRFQDKIRPDHCTTGADKWLELLADAGFSGNPCKILSCGGKKSVITATKTDALKARILSGLLAKNTWVLLNFDGDGKMEEIKNCIELTTNRNVVVLDVNLEGSELNDFLRNSLLHNREALEGILIWMLGKENKKSTGNVEPNTQKVLEPLLYLSKHLIELKLLPKLVVITEGCWQNLDAAKINGKGVSSAQIWGFVRILRLESKIRSTLIDLDFGTPRNEQIYQIIANMWLDDNEVEVKYDVDGNRHVRRISTAESTTFADLTFPNRGHYRVKLPDSKNINDVKFEEMLEEEMCEDEQIKVEVRSVSLNFKDVLAILKPSKDFQDLSSIGLDFSGVVVGVGTSVSRWKIGDSVFGCDLTGKCMQSQVTVNQNGVIAVPPEMSFSEAATLPAVILTAWYCMKNIAKLQKGQTVLIHAASGGVGLAAIQIAKLLGVTLIGTAGSERKRRFLRGLGMEHVFNSRDLEFKDGVEKVTMGHGVDMVLNCLTGPGFKEASLDVCRDGGHFVEISKMDNWTDEEVKKRRPHVFYNIVDMTKIDSGMSLHLLSTLSTFLKQGKITPLHHTEYPATRLVDALVYLQKARQIGKVVINMPRLVESGCNQLLFNDKSTYLITGGMGAVGFAICRWMISKGAKYVVLIGRNQPNSDISQEIMKLNTVYDSFVSTKQLDISDYQQCENFIKEELKNSNLPPLRGIHHCAVALSDKMIVSHDWHSFQNVFQAKVAGAWNLHRCTLHLPLQFFVLHSSAVATFGNMGQSNYAAANAYLDSLEKYRHSCGLSGVAINWGAWQTLLSKNITVDWAPHFSVGEGIRTLERIMNEYQHESNIVAGVFNVPLIREKFPQLATLLEKFALDKLCSNGSPCLLSANKRAEKIICSDEFADKYLRLKDPDARYEFVRSSVLQVICETMGALGDIPEDLPLSEVGMDSLMSIEVTNKLSVLVRELGKKRHELENEMKETEVNVEANTTFGQMTKYVSSILEV